MVKVFLRLKQNNKGVSLVEVLVTVAMIAIMAGPLLNSFLNARGVNSNARVIQNGTIVAQDTAEEFEALPLAQIIEKYKKNMDTAAMAKQEGVYIFKNIKVTGANKESFYVDVTLDPSTYAKADGSKVQVNNVKLPSMSSLYSSDSVMLYKYYTEVDGTLKDLFAGRLESDILVNLYNPAYRQKLSKETDINIKCQYNASTKKYRYDIELIMRYSYAKSATDVVTVTEKQELNDIVYTANQIHSMYLVCPVFDLCTRNVSGNISYATDKINIKYDYTGDVKAKQNLYFYIAQQDANNLLYNTKQQKIHKDNIKLMVDSNNISNPYNDTLTNVKLYTNISGDTSKGLTYTDVNSGVALYDMKVEVKYKDKVVAEFKTTK